MDPQILQKMTETEKAYYKLLTRYPGWIIGFVIAVPFGFVLTPQSPSTAIAISIVQIVFGILTLIKFSRDTKALVSAVTSRNLSAQA